MAKIRNSDSYKAANRIAKDLTVYAFRNGPVEDMHANCQLSQEDMKTLNKYLVDALAKYFYLCYEERYDDIPYLLAETHLYHREWDDADISNLEEDVEKIKGLLYGYNT